MNQHSILLEYLRLHGRTSCADLERHCDVRSVTTRMSELIRKGQPIEKSRAYSLNRRGKPRPVTYYALAGTPAQRDLFPPA
ncbi:MAG: helix-turn-helix domain-containing protein [Gallionella sp.]|nr:helix-turn-helix domain-containing protein [Gallionella sp.]